MHADIEQLADYTFSAVAEGYDAFLLRDLLHSSKQDILYIVSDGLSLERTAELLKNVAPDVEVLKFPAWDTLRPRFAKCRHRCRTGGGSRRSDLKSEPEEKTDCGCQYRRRYSETPAVQNFS